MFLTLAALGIALKVAITAPIGTAFDELAHYSFLRATAERPRLFADHDAMRMLDSKLRAWTEEANYITHPPLYYLLMTPLATVFPTSPLPIRLVDATLAVMGFALAGLGGLSRLTVPRTRVLFVAAVFGPPASIGVAGLVNNDALMGFEIGLLFWLVCREHRHPIAEALILAALGWTKLVGFAAGVLFVGFVHVVDIARGREPPVSRAIVFALLGLAIGFVPTIANLVLHHRIVWVPAAFPDWFEIPPPAHRDGMSLGTFAGFYFDHLGRRLPYRSDAFDALPVLIALFVTPFLAARRIATAPDSRNRTLAIAALVTIAIFAALHFTHAWITLTTRGTLADLQPRYLLAIWPMLAFAAALGVHALPPLAARLLDAGLLAGLAAISLFGCTLLLALGLG